MPRFGFLSWDWKDRIDIKALNRILKCLKDPEVTEFSDVMGSDAYYVAVHDGTLNLKRGDWGDLSNLVDGAYTGDDPRSKFWKRVKEVSRGVYEMPHEDIAAFCKVQQPQRTKITHPVILAAKRGDPAEVLLRIAQSGGISPIDQD